MKLRLPSFQSSTMLGSGDTLIAERLNRLLRQAAIAFGVLLLAYLGVAVFNTRGVAQQTDLGALAQAVQGYESALLQMRRNEKDFFERKTQEELDKHKSNDEESLALLKAAKANPAATDEEVRVLTELEKTNAAYRQAFLAAANTQIALGVDENAGLQGALRKAVREAEALADKSGALDIENSVLQLRRHEKDFILRERQEFADRHAKEAQRLQQLIAGARLDGAARAQLAELAGAYDKTFKEFAAGTIAVNQSIATARAAARAAEEPLPGLLKEVAERRDAAATRVRIALLVSIPALLAVLAAVGWMLYRTLTGVRVNITHSVHQLQNTVERVRGGEQLTAESAVVSADEMGQVWRSVDALLTDRLNAQRAAESENERLNNSVISILQAVNQLSQRDLTAKAPVTEDIIGTVSDSINLLTDETNKVLHGVTRIAGEVRQVSGNVKTQAELVSKTAEDERKSVNQMIQALAEATQMTDQVAKVAEQSNRSAEQATQATDTALETVTGTVRGMESIRETISETEKRIKRLGERSQEITGIVNLINTISERTHVLALNASMQAAVAGEAGRGFAVVAEEVQRLAESSRNATQQIGTLVNNIQLETNETIATVNRTIGQVVQGSEQAQRAGEQMRRTQEITAALVEQVRRIAAASGEQKQMSETLMKSVQTIGQSTERTAAQIQAQTRETDTLLDSARRLVDSVNVFKLMPVSV
ncbi:methyl-accepting chemotaxis protein [Ramlibacter tataouinensis]|uniref:Candidate twitching motility protein, methyl-accepting chemotaxis protein n=1 Tax=Ramlibacter tataouinensis (strain ATCC BAA-407 / DSM 14655 / LMG 21543 / TTB310) TaxID=365046 RepID=F5XX80_RAMTT|nr:methyl-accepting chemotaxis protein [Ramlibacter tataouinensis]AEG93024.1 Candidate twitching motility protein, methyl-accepting chemotaxis protein [Ramlibacter tataouinensis TTB310]